MQSSKPDVRIVLINVSGRDRPGITAGLTAILAEHGARVLDIDQAVIHQNLAWGMLIELADGSAMAEATAAPASDTLFRDLLFKAHELDLDIRFSPVSDAEYAQWVAAGGQDRCIITLLGRRVGADHISQLTQLVSSLGWNIASIERISPRSAEADRDRSLIAVELKVRAVSGNVSQLQADCLSLSSTIDADIAVQEDTIWRRNRRLVCFDMDSTLVQGEAIDLMAVAAGVGDEVAAITARAMNGEIDFRESFTRRLSLLEGLSESALADVDRQLVTTEGAERLIGTLKRLGYRTAIISGGFTWFGERLQKRLGIDFVHANELEITNGVLTGRIIGDIVDERGKAERMAAIAKAEGIGLEQVIAVGDGANDIPMLAGAGLGIAYHAKPAVREQAQNAFGSVGLDGILYLIGLREREIH